MALGSNDKDAILRCEAAAETLDKGGFLEPYFQVRGNFLFTRNHTLEQKKKSADTGHAVMMQPGIDNVSADNICHEDVSVLTDCSIQDLLDHHKGKPARGKILWVESTEPMFAMACLMALVKDSKGTFINLSLYNTGDLEANEADMEKEWPVGLRIGIKSPYLKLANNGNLALRVDNPTNCVFVRPPAKRISAAASTSASSASAHELKSKGNISFKKQAFVNAAEEYREGIASAKLLIASLYSNRAICLLKTSDNAGAERDCQEVLKMFPEHAKALHHLQAARKALQATAAEGDDNGKSEKSATATVFDLLASRTPEDILASASADCTAEELKKRGNDSFQAKKYTDAIVLYSDGIEAAKVLLCALRTNHAMASLKMYDYAEAERYCREVLTTDAEHTKALHLLGTATQGLEGRKKQQEGLYDFLSFPMKASMQSREENYYGPIEVRSAGVKGRGVFLTRDVRPGELLLAEKALAYKPLNKDEITTAWDPSTNTINDGSQHYLVSALVKQLSHDSDVNAQLSYLAYEQTSSNAVLPSMGTFRNNSFEKVPILSANRVKGIVNINAFSFEDGAVNMTMEEREELQRAYFGINTAVGIIDDFARTHHRRQKEELKRRKTTNLGMMKDGTALWAVGSLMNTSTHTSKLVVRIFFGSMLFVNAPRPMFKGEEVLIDYGDKYDKFGKQGAV